MAHLISTGKKPPQETGEHLSDDVKTLDFAMKELGAIYKPDTDKKPRAKKPGRKKKIKRKKKIVDDKTGLVKHVEVEVEEFVYDWSTCCCGVNHPPVPEFEPPHGKRCIFYWQIAERFPYITLYRALSTELAFKRADTDDSGLIELEELKALLKKSISGTTDRMVERTFKEIDTDESGSLDFLEALAMVDNLVQRRQNKLPEKVQKDYSKVCTIQ